MRFLLIITGVVLLAGAAVRAEVDVFRMDQERLWLTARNEPLDSLLQRFAAAGVDVQVDPQARKPVSGEVAGADLEASLDNMLEPFDYLLDWRRESGPLGDFVRLTGIRVFGKGRADMVRPLPAGRRIDTSAGGALRFLAREILVGFRPGSSPADLQALLARTGGTVMEASPELGIYRILLPEGANVPDLAAQLTNDPRIACAEPNLVYEVPRLQKEVSLLPVSSAGRAPPEGAVAVAVLDTGLAAGALPGPLLRSAFDATRPDIPLTADAAGHGSLMAQLAAGLADPFGNSASEGVPVLAVKAFADDGTADSFSLMRAMTYAVQNGAGPFSLSWGSETPSRFMESAVAYVLSQGRPVFAAVGNENSGRPMYPAAYPGVTGVAAYEGGRLADYSNRGDFADLAAPGAAGGAHGTSVATAYAARLAAQYMQLHPGVSAADTVAAMKKAAGPDGFLSEAAVKQLLAR